MNKNDHIKFLQTPNLEWDDVTEILIDLELEKYNLKDILTPEQIQEYDEIIELYEAQRYAELNKHLGSGFSRAINAEFQGTIEAPDELDGYEG
jgi:hypothetical protein